MNNVHHMIWVPGWTYADSEKPVVAYFRKKVVLSGKVKYIDLKISADTRYKLYINGTFVQCGPQKGNLESWHFDRMAESTFLREGENVIAIEVLRFPENPDKRNRSLLIGPKPFLYIEGLIKTTDVEIKLDGGNDWRCERASHVKLKREPFIPAPIHGIEEVHGKPFFCRMENGRVRRFHMGDGGGGNCRIRIFKLRRTDELAGADNSVSEDKGTAVYRCRMRQGTGVGRAKDQDCGKKITGQGCGITDSCQYEMGGGTNSWRADVWISAARHERWKRGKN